MKGSVCCIVDIFTQIALKGQLALSGTSSDASPLIYFSESVLNSVKDNSLPDFVQLSKRIINNGKINHKLMIFMKFMKFLPLCIELCQ